MLNPNEEAECQAVVAAALALIDECFLTAPPLSRPAPPRPSRRRRDELQQLRMQVADLEQTIADLRVRNALGPLDGSSVAALWMQVAHSQHQQHHNVLGENAVLKNVVRTQQTLAHQLQRTVENLRYKLSVDVMPRALSQSILACVPLTNRLDAIAANVGPNWMMLLPTVAPAFRDHQAHLSTNGDGLRLEFWYAGYFPFKLSLVASEVWWLIVQQSLGTGTHLRVSERSLDEAFGHLTLRLRPSPSTRLEVHGPSAVRRVFTDNGSVGFAGTSISTVSASSDPSALNLMDGCEMHEASWLRVGRNPASPSLVYVESIGYAEIKPTHGHVVCEKQLQQIQDSLLREVKATGMANTQKLENRLLDATRGRSPPTHQVQ